MTREYYDPRRDETLRFTFSMFLHHERLTYSKEDAIEGIPIEIRLFRPRKNKHPHRPWHLDELVYPEGAKEFLEEILGRRLVGGWDQRKVIFFAMCCLHANGIDPLSVRGWIKRASVRGQDRYTDARDWFIEWRRHQNVKAS